MSCPPSNAAPELRPLRSSGITRPHRYSRPLRHPDRPGLPLAGVRLARATPPTGLPVLRPFPSCMRAAANTPAEPAGALVARFPADGSLPRINGGSASALPVSRPAQRSLMLRPACSLSRPRRPFSSECFRRIRYLLRPLRLLPAGATVAGRDSHPLRNGALARRTLSTSAGQRHWPVARATELGKLRSQLSSVRRRPGPLYVVFAPPRTVRRNSPAPAPMEGTSL